MNDPAGGGLFYIVFKLVDWLKYYGPIAILGFFVLLAVIMALSMIVERLHKRRKK